MDRNSLYIPLPTHAFERGWKYPEECAKCGDDYASHPHKFEIYAEHDTLCAACGGYKSEAIHGKPDSGFDIPDDE